MRPAEEALVSVFRRGRENRLVRVDGEDVIVLDLALARLRGAPANRRRHDANLYGRGDVAIPPMKLGITEYIDCAHHLPGHEKCGSFHGHTYQIDVFIEGDHRGGMILDFAELKKATRAVLAEYDHKDWNDFIEYPTVENICELISNRLQGALKFSVHVRVWEGHGKWAEV